MTCFLEFGADDVTVGRRWEEITERGHSANSGPSGEAADDRH
jgi:hypothetical protein